jgi:16S rRNA C967 or C1407 C5-methylase (RsmB/RsmF family)/NOL1/NOP2/fmu family ribosome biogenesis protein
MKQAFERYKSIIPGWNDFQEACRAPLPTCVWTNTLRTTPEILTRRFADQNLKAQEVPWYPGAFRLPPDIGIGSGFEYIAGLCHVQEEIAMLPAMLLAPGPGDIVLDMCAAPGNKTAQMSLMMQNQGIIVANDVNRGRMRAVKKVIERLGLLNVVTTLGNASAYARQFVLFDSVMADVLCSCEGTSRKNPELLHEDISGHSGTINNMQIAILKRALEMCKPGGRVMYTTCTYAPEENELVVDRVLSILAPKIKARVVQPDFPAIRYSAGLTSWQGKTVHKDLENTVRIYPHQNDTGGFFIALIEKEADRGLKWRRSARPPSEPVPAGYPHFDLDGYLEELDTCFGISRSNFSGFNFFRENKKTISVVSQKLEILPQSHSAGLPFVHVNMQYPKLTTAAAMLWGNTACRHVCNVTRQQLQHYLSGKTIYVRPHDIEGFTRDGYIIIKYNSVVIGLGLCKSCMDEVQIRSLFPKAWQLK